MLQSILNSHPGFTRQFTSRLYTNYIREPLPELDLTECDVFLYQYLGPEWGKLASEKLLSHVKASCATLCLPNMFLRTYWPLNSFADYVLRDQLLEDLWQRKLSRNEYLYLSTRPSLLDQYDVQAIVEKSLAHEQAKARRSPIEYLDQMLDNCTQKMTFYTPNHPGKELLLDVANYVLTWLDLSPINPTNMLPLDPYYTAMKMPVHPGLADLFSLTWLNDQTVFPVYGHQVTYAQFAWIYAEYRDSGQPSFIEFLGKYTARAKASSAEQKDSQKIA